jgi:(p)ppGpp synthase/HD superfamily hydrolase
MSNQDPTLQSPLEVEELGLKHKTEGELFQSLLEAGTDWSEEERGMVIAAYNLARLFHQDDEHRNLPYTYHLLRNANRVTGYLHINDPEIIAAVILHDSVEEPSG